MLMDWQEVVRILGSSNQILLFIRYSLQYDSGIHGLYIDWFVSSMLQFPDSFREMDDLYIIGLLSNSLRG